jgi:site-specific DNA-cytosine methylase
VCFAHPRALRGDLIFEYVRLLAESGADAFLFENVPNLATVDGGKVLVELKKAINGAGYSATDGAMLETCGSAGEGCTFPVIE